MYLLGNITAYLSDDIVAQYFGIVKVAVTFFLLFYLALFQSPRFLFSGGGLLLCFLFTLAVNVLLCLSDLSILLRLQAFQQAHEFCQVIDLS